MDTMGTLNSLENNLILNIEREMKVHSTQQSKCILYIMFKI